MLPLTGPFQFRGIMINKIHTGNCIGLTHKLPNSSIDFVFTSPPYGAGIEYDTWPDDIEGNKKLIKALSTVLFKKMKEDGRVALNIAPKVINTKERYPLFLEVCNSFIAAGFKFMDIVVWNRMNNGSIAWGVWDSQEFPNTIGTCELIVLFTKGSFAKLEKRGETMSHKEFLEVIDNIWHISPEFNKEHPAVFPLKLALNAIKLWSYPGDLVLDPFCGTGTTCLAAARLDRKWIGFEISEKYSGIASASLKLETSQLKLF